LPHWSHSVECLVKSLSPSSSVLITHDSLEQVWASPSWTIVTSWTVLALLKPCLVARAVDLMMVLRDVRRLPKSMYLRTLRCVLRRVLRKVMCVLILLSVVSLSVI